MSLCKITIRSLAAISVTVVAVALLVGFVSTMFELNANCLRYIDASKEAVGALQGVQDRIEQLRNLLSTDLTNVTTVQTLTPSNGSDFVQKVTEIVTLSAYPTLFDTNTKIAVTVARC